jgi:hypothetical protein
MGVAAALGPAMKLGARLARRSSLEQSLRAKEGRSGLGARFKTIRLAVSAVALVVVASSRALAGDNYALVITGASGGESYAKKYDGWRRAFVSTLREKFSYPDDHVVVLAERPEPGVAAATREQVQRTLVDLVTRLTKDDSLVVLLIGHGTSVEGGGGEDAKFNLVGPDLSASEWSSLLKPLAARLVFIDTTPVSFPFLHKLAGPGRIVITATDSSAQEFETVFGEWFVKAFAETAADADKNGRVSMLEAFTYASAGVRRWFDERNQLPTERPLLDDDGDGVGREAQNPGPDGAVARNMFLQPVGVPPEVARRALTARQSALEAEIEALKARRPSIPPDAYQAELERLLLELARVSAELRSKS